MPLIVYARTIRRSWTIYAWRGLRRRAPLFVRFRDRRSSLDSHSNFL